MHTVVVAFVKAEQAAVPDGHSKEVSVFYGRCIDTKLGPVALPHTVLSLMRVWRIGEKGLAFPQPYLV